MNIQFISACLMMSNFVFAQIPAVDVAELTLKIKAGNTEELYYGFEKGDKIIFSMIEQDGKELKTVELTELPNHTKFMDYKTAKVDSKQFTVHDRGVYLFKIENGAGPKIVKVKIQRIPEFESTIKFSTKVKWLAKTDTICEGCIENVLVGHDTVVRTENKFELVSSSRAEEMLIDKTQRVGAKGRETLRFELPKNDYQAFTHKEVLAWAYWVAVGEKSKDAWTKNIKTFGGLAKGITSMFVSPLGGLAVGLVVDLSVPGMGDDVYYCVLDETNKQLFLDRNNYHSYDEGKGPGGFGKNNKNTQGYFFIGLINENYLQGIDVNVKVSAVVETRHYENRVYQWTDILPRYKKVVNGKAKIETKKYPVND
jgi:hypothetical protein